MCSVSKISQNINSIHCNSKNINLSKYDQHPCRRTTQVTIQILPQFLNTGTDLTSLRLWTFCMKSSKNLVKWTPRDCDNCLKANHRLLQTKRPECAGQFNGKLQIVVNAFKLGRAQPVTRGLGGEILTNYKFVSNLLRSRISSKRWQEKNTLLWISTNIYPL